MNKPTTKEVARFWGKVQKTDSCWLWIAALNTVGYGRFWYNKKMVGAHRFSYELSIGQIPKGIHVLHKKCCGNRSCVNPNHLYMGTNADNQRDRVMWGHFIFGEAHNNAKLSEEDVLTIRSLRKNKGYTYKILADMFGVDQSHIFRIIHHQSWAHLQETEGVG